MIKIFSDKKLLLKSFDFNVIGNFIINNPELKLVFIQGLKVLSNNDFCKLFLLETNDFENYIKIETTLNKTPTIYALL